MLSIPSSTVFDIATGTWSLWAKSDGNWGVDGESGGTGTKGVAMVMDRHTGPYSSSGLSMLFHDTGTVLAQAKDAGGAMVANITGTRVVTNNAWHHIVVTYNQAPAGQMNIYIDGSPEISGTNTGGWTFNNQAVQVADSPDAYWEEFAGRIDDVRIYDKILSPTEVSNLYLYDSIVAPSDTTPPTPNPSTWATVSLCHRQHVDFDDCHNGFRPIGRAVLLRLHRGRRRPRFRLAVKRNLSGYGPDAEHAVHLSRADA